MVTLFGITLLLLYVVWLSFLLTVTLSYCLYQKIKYSDTTHLRVDIRDLEKSIQMQQDALKKVLFENGEMKRLISRTSKQNDRNKNHHVDIKLDDKSWKQGRHDGFDVIDVNSNGSTYQPMSKNILLGMDTFLLIMCSNRPDYLKRALDFVLLHHPR